MVPHGRMPEVRRHAAGLLEVSQSCLTSTGSPDQPHSSSNSRTSSTYGDGLFLSAVSSTIFTGWNRLSPFLGALRRGRLLACAGFCSAVLPNQHGRRAPDELPPFNRHFAPKPPFRPLFLCFLRTSANPSVGRESSIYAGFSTLDFLGSLSPPLAGRDGGPDESGLSQFDSDTVKENRLASKTARDIVSTEATETLGCLRSGDSCCGSPF
jgi:hypothetical protein